MAHDQDDQDSLTNAGSRNPLKVPVSRRRFLTGAGAASLAAAASPLAGGRATAATPDGTPEQIHLTWGEDPTRCVVVSWASAAPGRQPARPPGHDHAVRPHAFRRFRRTYTDGLNGQTVFTYHARLDDLSPDSLIHYSSRRTTTATPHSRSRRASARRLAAARRFAGPASATSRRRRPRGCCRTPQSAFAVQAVEQFQPLFHLLNGDLCYANLNPTAQPAVWARLRQQQSGVGGATARGCRAPATTRSSSTTASRASRRISTRYTLARQRDAFPGPLVQLPRRHRAVHLAVGGRRHLPGRRPRSLAARRRWSRRPARAIRRSSPARRSTFMAIAAANRRAGSSTPCARRRRTTTSTGSSCRCIRTRCGRRRPATGRTRASARPGCRCSTATASTWCVCGHDHDYERSWPVRGFNHDIGQDIATGGPVDTFQPNPVVAATDADGASTPARAPIHLILGGGGTSAPLDVYGVDAGDGAAAGQGFHQAEPPGPGRDRRAPSYAGRRTRSKTRSGRPSATPARATASRCSISTPAMRAARRRSRSTTTTRRAPTRRRRRTTSCSRRSSWPSTSTTAATGNGGRFVAPLGLAPPQRHHAGQCPGHPVRVSAAGPCPKPLVAGIRSLRALMEAPSSPWWKSAGNDGLNI